MTMDCQRAILKLSPNNLLSEIRLDKLLHEYWFRCLYCRQRLVRRSSANCTSTRLECHTMFWEIALHTTEASYTTFLLTNSTSICILNK